MRTLVALWALARLSLCAADMSTVYGYALDSVKYSQYGQVRKT